MYNTLQPALPFSYDAMQQTVEETSKTMEFKLGDPAPSNHEHLSIHKGQQ